MKNEKITNELVKLKSQKKQTMMTNEMNLLQHILGILM